VLAAAFAGYVAVVAFGVAVHEPWWDEAQAWLLDGRHAAEDFEVYSGVRQAKKKRPSSFVEGLSRLLSRRRPTFPRSCPRSIIGDERLNCRVRNGNGCDPLSMTTGNLILFLSTALNTGCRDAHCRQHQIKAFMVKPNDRLVLVSYEHRCSSTSSLSTWSSTTGLQGELILWLASRLYAFSDYPFPT
jgi:hypothetical protein